MSVKAACTCYADLTYPRVKDDPDGAARAAAPYAERDSSDLQSFVSAGGGPAMEICDLRTPTKDGRLQQESTKQTRAR